MVSLIAAIQESNNNKLDRGLGFNNGLIYKLAEDQKRFREETSGHPIIMGRKTFESIGRALPNRTNIVVSSQTPSIPSTPNLIFVQTPTEALKQAEKSSGAEKIFIIGGSHIYNHFISLANELILTIIPGDLPADVFFPEYKNDFKVINSEELFDETSQKNFSIQKLIRR